MTTDQCRTFHSPKKHTKIIIVKIPSLTHISPSRHDLMPAPTLQRDLGSPLTKSSSNNERSSIFCIVPKRRMPPFRMLLFFFSIFFFQMLFAKRFMLLSMLRVNDIPLLNSYLNHITKSSWEPEREVTATAKKKKKHFSKLSAQSAKFYLPSHFSITARVIIFRRHILHTRPQKYIQFGKKTSEKCYLIVPPFKISRWLLHIPFFVAFLRRGHPNKKQTFRRTDHTKYEYNMITASAMLCSILFVSAD